MREQMERRLEELHAELETGKRALAELEGRREALTQTMLRIGGAIQVIQEMLAAEEASRTAGAAEVATSDPSVRRLATR